jgi:hypothetical protein
MPRQLWLADKLREAGLKVAEVIGWQTRGSSYFSPRMVVCHHTAGARIGEAPSLNVVRDGRPGLPGPLSQLVLGRSGTYYVVASGRSNHAGTGMWKGVYGNTASWGIEAENAGDGTDQWPTAQLDAYVRGVAVLCENSDISSDMVCGHREYATPRGRKVDPVGIDMNEFREKVHRVLAGEVPLPPLIPKADPVTGRATLRRGSTGELVRVLQRAVGVVDDGDFGPMTEAAVRAFQRSHNLLADGICGPLTWAVINTLLI